VLSADHNLIVARGYSRTRIDAGTTTRLDGVSSGLLKNLQISAANAVVARLLRSKLNVKLNRISHALSLLHRVCEHPRVHIHVFVFAGSARSPISKFNRDGSIQLANIFSVSW